MENQISVADVYASPAMIQAGRYAVMRMTSAAAP
jgi:hypothetical protein